MHDDKTLEIVSTTLGYKNMTFNHTLTSPYPRAMPLYLGVVTVYGVKCCGMPQVILNSRRELNTILRGPTRTITLDVIYSGRWFRGIYVTLRHVPAVSTELLGSAVSPWRDERIDIHQIKITKRT